MSSNSIDFSPKLLSFKFHRSFNKVKILNDSESEYWKNHRDDVLKARQIINERKLCIKCLRKLVPIGHARDNGKNHNDWNDRQLHKKCFKEI